jgi:hypothetical protein
LLTGKKNDHSFKGPLDVTFKKKKEMKRTARHPLKEKQPLKRRRVLKEVPTPALPPEMWTEIFSHLTVRDLLTKAALLSHDMAELARRLFRRRLMQDIVLPLDFKSDGPGKRVALDQRIDTNIRFEFLAEPDPGWRAVLASMSIYRLSTLYRFGMETFLLFARINIITFVVYARMVAQLGRFLGSVRVTAFSARHQPLGPQGRPTAFWWRLEVDPDGEICIDARSVCTPCAKRLASSFNDRALFEVASDEPGETHQIGVLSDFLEARLFQNLLHETFLQLGPDFALHFGSNGDTLRPLHDLDPGTLPAPNTILSYATSAYAVPGKEFQQEWARADAAISSYFRTSV